MKRRTFIQNTAVMASGTLLQPAQPWAISGMLPKVGIQLFSLPKKLEQDFRQALAMLAQMGYKELELYGPYPFSVPEVIQSWKALEPMLGFNGSGFFGLEPKAVKAIFKEYGLKTPAAHTDLGTLETRMGQLAEAADILGFTYVGLPAIPDTERKTLDDYRRMADRFNKIGASAKKYGLKFSYHNHGYGLKEMNGQIPLYVLLDATDASAVFLEMDIYWTTAGGMNPVELLKKYPRRYHLMHIKDMKEQKRFAGDGGDAGQWIALFPFMTSAGDGILDLPAIINQAKKSGVKHFFVEQDMVANPEVALKRSIDYLGKL